MGFAVCDIFAVQHRPVARHRFRLIKSLVRIFQERFLEKCVPNWDSGEDAASLFLHWLVIVVASPDAYYKRGCIADSPGIAIVIGGSGFQCHLAVRENSQVQAILKKGRPRLNIRKNFIN